MIGLQDRTARYEGFSDFSIKDVGGAKNAMRSKLDPMKKVVKMLRHHQERLLNLWEIELGGGLKQEYKKQIQTRRRIARSITSAHA
jgi:predicted DNA-binding protein YlxM (UPF0122 family)